MPFFFFNLLQTPESEWMKNMCKPSYKCKVTKNFILAALHTQLAFFLLALHYNKRFSGKQRWIKVLSKTVWWVRNPESSSQRYQNFWVAKSESFLVDKNEMGNNIYFAWILQSFSRHFETDWEYWVYINYWWFVSSYNLSGTLDFSLWFVICCLIVLPLC